jgi:hypothetical protein
VGVCSGLGEKGGDFKLEEVRRNHLCWRVFYSRNKKTTLSEELGDGM